MVNKCFESVVDEWVNCVWLSRIKGGGGKKSWRLFRTNLGLCHQLLGAQKVLLNLQE